MKTKKKIVRETLEENQKQFENQKYEFLQLFLALLDLTVEKYDND